MSIVYIDLCSSIIGDLLETTWDTGKFAYEALYSRNIDLLRHEYSNSTENIGNIELSR
jgi:hypothetical protein